MKRKEKKNYINRNVTAKEICDTIMNQIKRIFCFISHCSAISLLEALKFQEYEKNFPTLILKQPMNDSV